MSNVIYLKENSIYFYATFFDEDLKIPSIDTWIFKGIDSELGYIFQDASDEMKQYSFQGEIESNILDHQALSKWLLEEHSPKKPKKEYIYKTL